MPVKDKVISKEKSQSFDRYLFETELFDVSIANKAAEEAKILTEEDLAQAESRGYSNGLADGKQQATEDFTQTLKAHTDQLTKALQNAAKIRQELEKTTQEKAFVVLQKLTTVLLEHAQEHYPDDLLKRLLNTLEEAAKKAPELMVRVAPSTKEYVCDTLLKASPIKGLSADAIKTDPTLKPGDCVLEWDDGGLDLRLEAVQTQIIALLNGAASLPPESTQPEEEEEVAPTQSASEENPSEETLKSAPEHAPEETLADAPAATPQGDIKNETQNL